VEVRRSEVKTWIRWRRAEDRQIKERAENRQIKERAEDRQIKGRAEDRQIKQRAEDRQKLKGDKPNFATPERGRRKKQWVPVALVIGTSCMQGTYGQGPYNGDRRGDGGRGYPCAPLFGSRRIDSKRGRLGRLPVLRGPFVPVWLWGPPPLLVRRGRPISLVLFGPHFRGVPCATRYPFRTTSPGDSFGAFESTRRCNLRWQRTRTEACRSRLCVRSKPIVRGLFPERKLCESIHKSTRPKGTYASRGRLTAAWFWHGGGSVCRRRGAEGHLRRSSGCDGLAAFGRGGASEGHRYRRSHWRLTRRGGGSSSAIVREHHPTPPGKDLQEDGAYLQN